jgi:hypothetical protein
MAAAKTVCELLQGLLLEDVAAAAGSSSSSSGAFQQTSKNDVDSWGCKEELVELPWQGSFGSSSGTVCCMQGPDRAGQLAGASAAAGACGVDPWGVAEGGEGVCSMTEDGLSVAKAGVLQSSTSAAFGMGLSAVMVGRAGAAGGASCCEDAMVQCCFAQQQQQCVANTAAGPDFVEWDSWYSGLAALVEHKCNTRQAVLHFVEWDACYSGLASLV